MTAHTPKHKWRKTIFLSLAILALLVLLAVLFINTYLTNKLSEKLKTTVLTSSDSLYRISFSKADLNIFSGSAVLYNITLNPDTAIYHRLQKTGKATPEVYELKVNRLVITGAHPLDLYFHKKLEIGKIMLDSPNVQVNQYKDSTKKSPVKDERTIYQKLSKSLKLIHVGEINLNNIHFRYQNFTGRQPKISVLDKMNLKATDLLIDSATQHDNSRTLFCKNIETSLDHFNAATADGLYKFKVRAVRLSTAKSLLTLTGVDMTPIAANTFFAKSKLDRYTLHLDSVAISNVTFESLEEQSDLNISKLTVSKGAFNVYPNPNVPGKKSDRVVSFPNRLIGHMKNVINVDTFSFKHLNISYTSFNKDSKNAGTISFNNTTGQFLNITNQKDKIIKKPYGTIRLTTYLMGKGKLDLSMAFKLNDAAYHFNYKGHLGPMDLRDGNSALVPLGLIKAQSGEIKSLDFNINASKKTATGKVTVLYQNLKAELLRRNGDGYNKKILITALANLIVLKSNNPDNAISVPRSASVIYVRPISTPFFRSIWLTLLSGIKECAGVGKADNPPAKTTTDKELKKQAKDLKKAQKKAEKEQKKQAKALKKAMKRAAKEEQKQKGKL